MPEKTKIEKVKKEKVLTDSDMLKYEIADELGLLDKVRSTGWKSLTSKESGRIGGLMHKRAKQCAKGNDTDLIKS
ncbi:MAG: alpha/beta-type small acid-soluble spore protein [Clostridiales bacterium]|jgi:hypothetical protein|nr:alpha/beta-type small acid-soluble spore protein [Clostridiales bacterium]